MGRAFRELALLAALALLPALVSGVRELQWRAAPPPLREGEVTAATAQLWAEQVVWVDARPRSEFERRSIPGALPLTPDDWDAEVPKLLDAWEPEKAIVVFGRSANDDSATSVAHRLKEELQLESVWILQGGWEAWTQL